VVGVVDDAGVCISDIMKRMKGWDRFWISWFWFLEKKQITHRMFM
jgi:hypothetical protein